MSMPAVASSFTNTHLILMQSVCKRQACSVTSQGALLSHLSKVELLYASSGMPPHPRANTPLTISPYSFPVTISCLLLLLARSMSIVTVFVVAAAATADDATAITSQFFTLSLLF